MNKVTIVREETASHNVDPQNGFTPLCPNELPVEGGHEIVDELIGQNKLCKYSTVSKDVHPRNAIWIANENQPQLSPIKGDNVDVAWNTHCMSGTYGVELIGGLKMTDYDFFLAKGFEPDLHPYSSCYHDKAKTISTGLIEWYKVRNIDTVVVGGLALDFCVKETIIDLVNAGFKVILNLGGCRGIGSETALKECVVSLVMKYNIRVVDSYKNITVI